MGKSLNELELSLQAKAIKAIAEMRIDSFLIEKGVEKIEIAETRRSLAVQMAYYSRGRMKVEDVQKMYRHAGLYNISEEEAQIKNTWTLDSKHIHGKAVDIVPVKDGKIWWTAPKEIWQRMGEIGEKYGMIWGGRWKNTPDTPHFEI